MSISKKIGLPLSLGVLAALLLSGCGTAPTHPSLASAEMPELIPVRRVVADIDYSGGFFLSPDGRHLLWSRPAGLDVGLASREIDRAGPIPSTPDRSFATGHLARPLGATNFGWLANSRHAYYMKDLSGAENTQIVIFDTQSDSFDPWVVTPWAGTRSYLLHEGTPGSTTVLFASNRRDRSTFDVYKADFVSRQIDEIARSDGTVLQWVVDTEGKLAGRIRQLGKEDGADQVMELVSTQPGEQWQVIRKIGGFDWW